MFSALYFTKYYRKHYNLLKKILDKSCIFITEFMTSGIILSVRIKYLKH